MSFLHKMIHDRFCDFKKFVQCIANNESCLLQFEDYESATVNKLEKLKKEIEWDCDELAKMIRLIDGCITVSNNYFKKLKSSTNTRDSRRKKLFYFSEVEKFKELKNILYRRIEDIKQKKWRSYKSDFINQIVLFACKENSKALDVLLSKISSTAEKYGSLSDVEKIYKESVRMLFEEKRYNIVIWFTEFLLNKDIVSLCWGRVEEEYFFEDWYFSMNGFFPKMYYEAIVAKEGIGNTNNIRITYSFNKTKYKYYDCDSILNFGKYKGKTVKEIFCLSPNYIAWCCINLDFFLVDTSVLLKNAIENEKWYYKAIISILEKTWIELLQEQQKNVISQKRDRESFYGNNYISTDWNLWNDNLDWDQQDAEFWDQF